MRREAAAFKSYRQTWYYPGNSLEGLAREPCACPETTVFGQGHARESGVTESIVWTTVGYRVFGQSTKCCSVLIFHVAKLQIISRAPLRHLSTNGLGIASGLPITVSPATRSRLIAGLPIRLRIVDGVGRQSRRMHHPRVSAHEPQCMRTVQVARASNQHRSAPRPLPPTSHAE